jgi:flagellar biogenesis protein FliO
MGDNIGSTLFYIFVMVAVLLAAYFTTKYLSGKARHIVKSRHIVVLDRMGIAKDKMLLLVKVGGKNLLIGITNQNINSLGEVDIGETPEENNEPKSTQGTLSKFAQILSNAKKAPDELAKVRREARQKKNAQPEPRDAIGDDYIEQMTRAIERRKNLKTHDNEGIDE